MANYTKILVAVDLSDDSNAVIERGLAISANNNAELHVIHVIEPLSFAYGGDIPMDFSGIQDEIHQQASIQLKRFGDKHGIGEDKQHIVLGRPEVEVHNKAEETGADLIVIGSHGRHGLALLLGSTANGVLYGARCDVLAVRVGD